MNRQAIRVAVIEILEAEVGNRFPDVRESDSIREVLGLDSVEVVSVVTEIERRFLVSLTLQEMETVWTFGEVLDVLQAKLDRLVAA